MVEQKQQQQQRTQTSAAGLSLCLVGVDATPSPGLKRLFNFFGILTQEEVGTKELVDAECFISFCLLGQLCYCLVG